MARLDDEKASCARRSLRRRGWLIVGVVLAVVAVLGVGVGLDDDNAWRGSNGRSPDGDQGITIAQDAACSRIIVVGRSLGLRPADRPHRVILTFVVQDWIKPAHGDGQIAVNIIDPRRTETSSWKAGTRMLLVVRYRDDRLVESVRGTALIRRAGKEYERVVSKPNHAKCPKYWRPK